MSFILDHIQKIVGACHPESREEAIRLWHDIKPLKFGDRLTWVNSVNRQILALYQVPENASYLVILRTECYTYTEIAIAPSFRSFEPPPAGNLQWFVNTGAGPEPITGLVPTHILADVEELLIVKDGITVSLEGVLAAPPDANARFVRTTVYAYHVTAEIADRIGSAEVLPFGRNT